MLTITQTAASRKDARSGPIAATWIDYKKCPTQDLRNRLVEHHLPFVMAIAQKMWVRLPNHVELDDLVSDGVFGLIDAIESFDLERGVEFKTYSATRIHGAMLDGIRRTDWVPRSVRARGEPVARMVQRATTMTTTSKFRLDRGSAKDSQDFDNWNDPSECREDTDPTRPQQNRDLMQLVIRGFNRKERLVVILYYYEEMTMKEIAASLDLSESRVSQIHTSIVERLRIEVADRRDEFCSI